MRAEPRDDAEQVTQALAHEPLEVERIENGWARIRTAYGYPGWIRAEALGSSADELWMDRHATGSGSDPVTEARRYLGAPYEWGGMTERGIDCSGLVHMAFRRTGRLVPRDAHQQEAAARPVPEESAEPGDLVCFGEPDHAHHIAFWVGKGFVLHATSRRSAVVEEPLAEAAATGSIRFVRL